MKNQEYWSNFYKSFKVDNPSSFAIWIKDYLTKKPNSLLEFGCGNGRDSFYFSNQGINVTGVDLSSELQSVNNFKFIKSDVKNFIKKNKCDFNIVYTRFFLHSLENKTILKILKWSTGLFVAEFRAEEDKPILYPNHFRNLINGEWILSKMIQNKFEILFYQKEYNLSPMGKENPLLIRIIGYKHGK